MRIQVKDLISYLHYNSKMDKDDEIHSITVDQKKEVVKFEGRSKAKEGQDQLIISFNVPFDALLAPVSIRAGRMRKVTNLEDDEENDKIRDDSNVLQGSEDKIVPEDNS